MRVNYVIDIIVWIFAFSIAANHVASMNIDVKDLDKDGGFSIVIYIADSIPFNEDMYGNFVVRNYLVVICLIIYFIIIIICVYCYFLLFLNY